MAAAQKTDHWHLRIPLSMTESIGKTIETVPLEDGRTRENWKGVLGRTMLRAIELGEIPFEVVAYLYQIEEPMGRGTQRPDSEETFSRLREIWTKAEYGGPIDSKK